MHTSVKTHDASLRTLRGETTGMRISRPTRQQRAFVSPFDCRCNSFNPSPISFFLMFGPYDVVSVLHICFYLTMFTPLAEFSILTTLGVFEHFCDGSLPQNIHYSI